jgi:glycosyltransferase involved in cell wall biosynthesis
MLNKPVIITGRGTDINVFSTYRLHRRMILWAARHAAASVTVCQALKNRLVEMGVAEKHIRVLRNGVDLQLFRPVDRPAVRQRLGLDSTTLLFVGHLVRLKGHDIVIRALQALPKVHLLIAGDGEEKIKLRMLADSLGVSRRVTFLGSVLQEDLIEYYGGVDALVLASSREGWANVLLEAMACGTPVIASNVGGTPEVVATPEAGVLMRERTPEGVVEAFHTLFSKYPSRDATRRYAERFSWDETTQLNLTLLRDVLAQ